MARYILTAEGKLLINALCRAWLSADAKLNANLLTKWPHESQRPPKAGIAKVFKELRNALNWQSKYPHLTSGYTLFDQWEDGQEAIDEPAAYVALAELFVKVRHNSTLIPGLTERFNVYLQTSKKSKVLIEHLVTPFKASQLIFSLVHDSDRNAIDRYIASELAAAGRFGRAFDQSFVNLSMMMLRGEESKKSATVEYFDNLSKVLEDTHDSPVIILLGASGAGKTTLLQKQLYDAARLSLNTKSSRIPFYASLAGFGVNSLTPEQWLNSHFTSRASSFGLEDFTFHMKAGKCLLLLDALNEMPPGDSLQNRITQWSEFIRIYCSSPHRNRVVIACRKLDYSIPFFVEGMNIPQVSILPMDSPTIHKYIVKCCGNHADSVWQQLSSDNELLNFYETPFYLWMLVDAIHSSGQIPRGRSLLFIKYLWELLRREYLKNPSLFAHNMLAESDMLLLSQRKIVERLPKGVLIDALAHLAIQMQDAQGPVGTRSVTEIPTDEATRLIEREGLNDGRQILKAALSLHVLCMDPVSDSIRFYHQLIQEAFASIRMVQDFDASKWRVKWQTGDVTPTEIPGKYDRLPPLPGSGWEEPTVVAAGLHSDPDEFVHRVLEEDVVLAGRCAASADVHLSSSLREKIQGELFKRMHNKEADLRARIQAGLQLENLELLGFTYHKREVEHLLPPFVKVPFDSVSECNSEYARTQISAYPVTNAEYSFFMRNGGYECEQWWIGEESKNWLSGKSSLQGMEWQRRTNRAKWIEWGEQYIRNEIGRRWTTEEAELMIIAIHDADAFDKQCRTEFAHSVKIKTPLQWHNIDFNRASQPVVGISWFEAMAYCEWLSAVSGSRITLMSEKIYERAAGGLEERVYAFGNEFRSELCNTYASHIWKPTPVGLFENAIPEGAYDLTGNVWTWVNTSLYDGDVRMVTKGGSYDTQQDYCKCKSRDGNHPGYRDRYDGFRIALIIG